MIFQSFTGTWLQFSKGEVTPSQLQAPDVQLQFGCTRGHLFPPLQVQSSLGEPTFPFEVSWAQGMKAISSPSQIPAAIVPLAILNKFKQFLAIVKALDSKGSVEWRTVEPARQVALDDQLIEDFKRETWLASYPEPGQRVMWADRIAYINEAVHGTGGTCRVLLAWYHPEDGMQKTWVDSRETSQPWPSIVRILS